MAYDSKAIVRLLDEACRLLESVDGTHQQLVWSDELQEWWANRKKPAVTAAPLTPERCADLGLVRASKLTAQPDARRRCVR